MSTDVLLSLLVVMVSVELLITVVFAVGAGVFMLRRLRSRRVASHGSGSGRDQQEPVAHPGWEFRPVSGGRITLGLLTQSDFDALYAMESDPRQFRYEIEEPQSRDEVAAKLTRGAVATRLEKPGDYLYPAIRDSNGNFLGTLYLRLDGETQDRTAEIGIALTRAAQRQGYAFEAAQLIFDVVFAKLRLHRLYAELDTRNIASMRLCESVGMRREADHQQSRWSKGVWIDTACYAILEHEWSLVHLSE